MRVAVSGADGRLGRALVESLESAPFVPLGPIAWRRPVFDLDRPDGIEALIEADRPEVVIHAAAWTDVDGCAREPALAQARNGDATGVLARACTSRGIDLVVVSTNEVFDGQRDDGRGYATTDPPKPGNPYGASKRAGEEQALAAFGTGEGALGIVRTSWLFGPGKPDFPSKILAAAEAATERGEPLRVVGDEWGAPTYAIDLAEAIVELIGAGAIGGIHHVVNSGVASRADWATDVIRRAAIQVQIERVPATTWQRASDPPRWGVLEPTPLPSGEPLRHWSDALADDMPRLLRARRPVTS